MDYNNLTTNDLLDLVNRYIECETSLEEENLLRRYFNEHTNIVAELKPYQAMFIYYQTQQTIQSKQVINVPPRRNYRTLLLYILVSSLVIGFAGWLVYNNNNTSLPTPNLSSQPLPLADNTVAKKKALRDTKAALLLVSKQLNKGSKKLKSRKKSSSQPL